MKASAKRHGERWGARARDWAENEDQLVPSYTQVLDRLDVPAGSRLLDVGCGSGALLRCAADRGLDVSGIDASNALVAIARERVPGADVRVGDMEELPFGDDAFDVVTGFSAFFFADDMVAALREAGRVARRGAPVLVQVWGDRENCDVIPVFKAAGSLRPPTGPGKPPAPPLSTPGLLEERTVAAGLEPETTFDLRYTVEYPDEATLLRRMLAVGGLVAATEAAGEEAVSAAILETLAQRRRQDGSYRLENEWRCLIARAP